MTKKKTLKFVDLFSGAGGISCGLEMAGLKCLLGADFNKDATNTFKVNHPKSEVFTGDLKKLTSKKLSEYLGNNKVDLVVGGPPCQGFSTVGTGNPLDERNSLFKEYVRIVKYLNPNYIIIENVTGLVAKKNEETLKAIFQKFSSLGYFLNVKVMCSDQYGVAEKRKRTIILGSKINEEVRFPKPTHNYFKNETFIPPLTVGEILLDLKKAKNLQNHDLKSAKIKSEIDYARLKCIPEGQGIRYQKDEERYFPKKLKLNINWSKLPEKRFRQTKYCRLNRKLPSPTIMTHRGTYYHPTQTRYLTAREAASIQSFPTDFVFTGTLSSQWRQIGNAVPPMMAKALGKAILSMYKDSLKSKTKADTKNLRKHNLKKVLPSVRKGAFIYHQVKGPTKKLPEINNFN